MKKVFIGICGGSASGKTTLCNQLFKLYKDDAQVISQDAYYHDRSGLTPEEIKKINFDSPNSVDLDQMYKDLVEFKAGNEVSIPQYCFKTHSRLKEKTSIENRRIILVEGLFVFETEKLRDLFDHKIYMSVDDDIGLIRRIKRDIGERGRDLESILEQYLSDVKPMYMAHIKPKAKYADYVIDTSGDFDLSDALNQLSSNINLVDK